MTRLSSGTKSPSGLSCCSKPQQSAEKAWQCLCITEFKVDPMRIKFSRLSSSCMSLLRLVERTLKTGFGNELSPQKLSLPGSPLTLHGPSVVMLYAGGAIANIWLSTRHTWDCMDTPFRRTSSLEIWSF